MRRAQSNPETSKNEVNPFKTVFWGWGARSISTPMDSDLKYTENTIEIMAEALMISYEAVLFLQNFTLFDL